MAFQHLEPSLHRLQQSFFYDVRKADYDFSGPFAYLKHHICDFVKIAFFNAQNEENAFEWPFDIMKHRFIDFTEVVF
jgi:hypothetical protein